jgi:hypothetical protein
MLSLQIATASCLDQLLIEKLRPHGLVQAIPTGDVDTGDEQDKSNSTDHHESIGVRKWQRIENDRVENVWCIKCDPKSR